MNLQALKSHPASVPCGSCRACCKQDVIALAPTDTHEKWHLESGRRVLDRKANGECVYLTDQGCSTHDNQPDICKRFDCRVLFLTTPKTQRRIRIQQNPTMREVYAAGKKRASTLEEIHG